MSIRWRVTGEMFCAANCEAMEGDTYIDDRLHYQLSVISGCIVADENHIENGLWHWLYTEEDLVTIEEIEGELGLEVIH